MKHSRRILAVLVAAALLGSMTALFASAATAEIKITNPYEGVNWGTYGQFRTQLHTHTTASDGAHTLAQMVEAYYAKGYHALAITDHGVVDRGWVNPNSVPFELFFAGIGSFFTNLFSEDQTTVKQLGGLTPARLAQINAGAGRADGRGMIRVPFGIEQNPGGGDGVGGLVHVNSFFTDWGNGYQGGNHDFSVAVRGVARAGGLSMINHPTLAYGNRNKTIAEVYKDDDDYLVNKLQVLFENKAYNPSLIGFEIHNATHDRKLWDVLLRNLAPTGRNIFIVPTDDSHNATTAVDRRWVVALMPSNTPDNLFSSLESGAFLGARRYVGDPMLQSAAEAAIDGDDEELIWLLSNTAAAEPRVTNITAQNGVISIAANNYDLITWISDGVMIAQGPTLDLAANIGKIGAYVRAEIWGEGVMLYTQPFLLDYASKPAARLVPAGFSDPVGAQNAFFRTLQYPLWWLIDILWRVVG